jgi:hypothetical protein
LLAELPVNVSAGAKLPLVIGKKKLSCSTGSSRPINPEPATGAVSLASPADTQSAAIPAGKSQSLQRNAPSPSRILENEPSSLFSQLNDTTSPAGAVEAIASRSSNADSSPILQEQQPPELLPV